MKEDLCSAFCQQLDVVEVPIGLAVGTGYLGNAGDRIGFYITGPDASGYWRIQDDGTTVPYIEASGADLSVSTRAEAFEMLLSEYGAIYDDEACELTTGPIERDDLPAAAIQFVALLLRVQDLVLLTGERARSTWVEEATMMLESAIEGKAEIVPDGIVYPDLAEFQADIVLRGKGREPVALFFGVSDVKVYEALLLHSYARYQLRRNCSVVVLLESDASVTKKARQRADNHVIVPRFKGAKADAIGRIAEEVIGERPSLYH